MSGTSPKQLEANRRNARLSTGPRTIAGKQRVKFNALKHGLLANAVIIPVRYGAEKRRHFDALLAQMIDELKPVGVLEDMLVEKIAVAYWRLRRALRAEAGEISDNIHDFRRYPYAADPATLALPSSRDTLKIVRYENAIERQLHRAINQLRSLQDHRCLSNPYTSETPPIDPN